MESDRSKKKFPSLKTGWLCLDFTNTEEWRAGQHPYDQLKSYEDLVQWSLYASLVTERDALQLLREADRRPAQADVAFERAIALREALYRVFSAGSRDQRPAKADLETVNSAVADAMARSQLVTTEHGIRWGWTGNGHHLERMIWPIARSAAELLTSADFSRVGECADERGCGWLFVDRSRNRSRRWCDMKDCGNRAKARRHYQRQKALA